MAPVEAAFRELWPQARVAHLLEDSLYSDFVAEGRLTGSMIERFRTLGRYCADAGAQAILFTCSAFGPAIDAVKRDLPIPVLKPNEALYDEIAARGERIALLATFAPTLPSMMAEIEEHLRNSGRSAAVEPHLVQGALDALTAGDDAAHDRLIAEAAAAHATMDAIALAQFSMAPARPLAEARVRVPVLTTPDSAVRKLQGLLG